jgi:DNA polymerase delta subunit 2
MLTTTTTTTATRRVYTEHQPKFQRFLFFPDTAADGSNSSTTTPYGRQYAHVYHERLSRLAPWIWQRIEKDTTNTNTNKVSRILELVEDVESTVVGTIIVVPTAANDNPDEYFLEDDSGRVALEFLPSTDDCFVTTGVVVGLTGTVGMDGVFRVKRLITAHSVRTVPVPLPPLILSTTNHPRNRQILLLSGLACGSSHSSSLSRSMLLSYLHGVFGHAAEQVSQVIIAGGLIAAHSDPNTHHHNPNEPTSILSTLQGCYELDGFVAQCTEAGIPVTLIPGQEDPTTAAWPQRPLHSSLLPRASSSTRLLTRATNPYT